MKSNVWKTKEIIGMAPMDGVTDAAMRRITTEIGKPSVVFTEFTNVEGLSRSALTLLDAFIYYPTQTPTIAQIFGTTPEDFYTATLIVCHMGFDGVDINMGCPDKNVSKRGAGAGLIRTPELASSIVKSVKNAVEDFVNGKKLSDTHLTQEMIDKINSIISKYSLIIERKYIPVSVKTRIGFDEIVTKDWITHLCNQNIAGITLHGRTLKQMYTGYANWDEIALAANIARTYNIPLLGNGDIKNYEDAKNKMQTYVVDGVLIGRATYGNPWIFTNHIPTKKEKLNTAVKHADYFAHMLPEANFLSLRKHLSWYCHGFDGAKELRIALMKTNSFFDVQETITNFLNTSRD